MYQGKTETCSTHTASSDITSDNPLVGKWTVWNQHLYLMVYNATDWENAFSICQEKFSNAHLVYIESEEENNFVHSMLTESDKDAWIGLSDADEEGTWKWGSVVADFFVWSEWSNEPDGGTRENCAVKLQVDKPWYDIECYHEFYFICERDFL
ncbi:hypothetical protein HOLleu_36721 [Holothuria leucospilota]|uniref:C-type lectin domain-containing protein n=1 Tax=Holothuria leucospilota TaxID=206669 RepID=A0A9Q1BFV4_HOLLE|nr:hypothetical protein HOLleu_36721 [Holothuria leucospilota]